MVAFLEGMYVQQNKLFQSKMGMLELNGVDSKKVLATLDEPCSGLPRKRRRLDDLTAEERVLRRYGYCLVLIFSYLLPS